MEFKGTKGEWKAVEYNIETKIGYSTHEIQYGNDGECVAEVVHGESNAKLIAAAPYLLEEHQADLRYLLAWDEYVTDSELNESTLHYELKDMIIAKRKAIEKALK